jgi:hypothetical protein
MYKEEPWMVNVPLYGIGVAGALTTTEQTTAGS